MFRYLISALCAAAVVGCSQNVMPSPHAPPAASLLSGIDLQYVDSTVRPRDDIYEYLNGQWLRNFQLPPDKGSYNSFTMVEDALQEQLHGIVDSLNQAAGDSDAKKLADFYASFMDEARLETLGLQTIREDLAAIDALKDSAALSKLLAHLQEIGVGAPFSLYVSLDDKNSAQYAVFLQQGGLGMPDRDYYLNDDAKLKETRAKYLAHIEKMLGMAGDAQAAGNAAAILALETSLARVQWTRVENRDPIKRYNKTSIADLSKLMPNFDWRLYLSSAALDGKVDSVVVNQPSYFTGLGNLLAATPLKSWQAYFKWRVLSSSAPYLSKIFVAERFAFNNGVLRGIPENLPRWKRGIAVLDGGMGEALGRRYVEKYFPPESKARMEALVKNLLEAYRRDIETLDWMSPATKIGAQAKLAKLVPKIGYPARWRDYSALRIDRDDLRGNVVRANQFEYQRNIAKLGQPIDRSEWRMTPQTVNASYNPTRNEIVFPAAILQPPFFDAQADDAANYGGIGAVIGHEISHGFDDSGSQYDADGNLHDWWTQADHDKFAEKTRALIAQYDAYEPVPDYHLNGALTLGENIGDNSGLAIAYQAYRLSLQGVEAPKIAGFSGDQRLYLGWVQVWRGKVREAEAIQRIKVDPHSPPQVRGTAPLRNQAAFYAAFGVRAGDKMYLAPDKRVSIW